MGRESGRGAGCGFGPLTVVSVEWLQEVASGEGAEGGADRIGTGCRTRTRGEANNAWRLPFSMTGTDGRTMVQRDCGVAARAIVVACRSHPHTAPRCCQQAQDAFEVS